MHYGISEHLSLLLQNMMNFVQIQLLFKGKISGSSTAKFFEICNFVVEKGRGTPAELIHLFFSIRAFYCRQENQAMLLL